MIWAVHISDGLLDWSWLASGWVGAGCLLLIGAWRIRDEEVPRIALLAAAFFILSLLSLRIGPWHVHPLCNGLLGVVLGRRSALAIPVALFLQAALFGHGGFTTIGVNSCVMTVPALMAWGLFAWLKQLSCLRQAGCRAALVAFCALAWILSLVFGLGLLWQSSPAGLDVSGSVRIMLQPLTLALALALAALLAWLELRWENAPEFPLGLLIGEMSVLATVFLNSLVLIGGSAQEWNTLVLALFVAHLPIAVVEGIVLGFALGFLARVKPELLHWTRTERTTCAAEPLP